MEASEANPGCKIMVGLSRRCESPEYINFTILFPALHNGMEKNANQSSIIHCCAVDESYKEVKRQIDKGLLGSPYLIKSATNDQYDPSGMSLTHVFIRVAIRLMTYFR